MVGNRAKIVMVSRQFKKFGTEIDFQIMVDEASKVSQARKDLEIAEEKCEKLQKIFSRFDRSSELNTLNSQLGKAFPASEQLLDVAKLALGYNQETQGYFDPRVIDELESSGYLKDFGEIGNSQFSRDKKGVDFEKELREDLVVENKEIIFHERMDFSGIVKGYAVDQIASFLERNGWKNFVVDCGGDMFFSGKDEEGKPWYIDIEGISCKSLMLELVQKGIATSGIGKRKWEIDGKRFHHLVNPKKIQQYCFDLKSVTVVADHTLEADVWAKTLFLMCGDAKIFAQENNLACAMLYYRGGVWISSEFKKYLHKKDV